MAIQPKRWALAVWLIVIAGFALLHALHLSADFPNNTPWHGDYAKYTDEGWYGNAAVRAQLFKNWYVPGDFNPAPAVPLLPLLEWMVFCVTGVTIEAARGLAVGFFLLNLLLSYLLLRSHGPRWMALLAITLVVTSPFLYCFSRLAILEPMLTAFTLAALNLAVRLARFRSPIGVSIAIGVFLTLMMLSKTTAVFLMPSVAWATFASLREDRKRAVRCLMASAAGFTATFGAWMALVVHFGLMRDYRYLFVVNKYAKPKEFYWPLLSLWWSFHGGLWVDRILIPLAGLAFLSAVLAWRSAWSRRLRNSPAFGASILAVAGYILFMTYQNHPQPRYFAVVAVFSFFVLAMGIEAALAHALADTQSRRVTIGNGQKDSDDSLPNGSAWQWSGARMVGYALLGAAGIAVCLNGVWTWNYATHPEYTFVPAAQRLTRYIDEHPNGKRLLLSISGDEITMITHLPTICDDFGTQDLVGKLAVYQPGWFATWNDLDPGTLEDLHNHYSLEQVASFHAFDDPDRNLLVLFKLHPLPNGRVRDLAPQELQVALPGDKIDIPIE